MHTNKITQNGETDKLTVRKIKRRLDEELKGLWELSEKYGDSAGECFQLMQRQLKVSGKKKRVDWYKNRFRALYNYVRGLRRNLFEDYEDCDEPDISTVQSVIKMYLIGQFKACQHSKSIEWIRTTKITNVQAQGEKLDLLQKLSDQIFGPEFTQNVLNNAIKKTVKIVDRRNQEMDEITGGPEIHPVFQQSVRTVLNFHKLGS